jgi:hypothetical protein
MLNSGRETASLVKESDKLNEIMEEKVEKSVQDEQLQFD